jgi:hypothetical protein
MWWWPVAAFTAVADTSGTGKKECSFLKKGGARPARTKKLLFLIGAR